MPGVGKTAVGRVLARKLGYVFLDIPEYVKRAELFSGYDVERDTALVETARLRRGLERTLDEDSGYVLSGHIVLNLPRFSTSCIVLRMNPLKLYGRLRERGYGPAKIAENLEAEFIGSSLMEAYRTFGRRRVKQLNVTGLTLKTRVGRCLQLLRGGRGENVDWPSMLRESELERLLRIMAAGRMAGLSKVF